MSYCLLIHTNNINLTYCVVFELQFFILDHCDFSVKISDICFNHSYCPLTHHKAPMCALIIIIIWIYKYIQTHQNNQNIILHIFSRISYIILNAQFSILKQANYSISFKCMCFQNNSNLFFCFQNSAIWYFYLCLGATHHAMHNSEGNNCFAVLRCGQDSKCGTTTVLTPALPLLCFSPGL